MFTYRDFITGKLCKTRGRFSGWTEPIGPLKARYAIFSNPKGEVLVPEYLLTKETKQAISRLRI